MNKVRKEIFGILVVLIMFSFFVFYWIKQTDSIQTITPGTSQPPLQTQEASRYTIGWSVYNSSYEFFQSMQHGVLDKAKELGINVITHDQRSSTAELITGAINLIDQGIDALVISPFNPNAMTLIVNHAKEKGIPVIVVDIGTGGTDVDAFIISDSFGGGVYAGEYALRLIKEHNIISKNAAIIKVEETAEYARRRGEGFKQVMTENNFNIVAEVTANSDTAEAYEAMRTILSNYKDDLAVVFTENDRMALGAAYAITQAGKKGQIMVIGYDGDATAISAIKDGLMQGTIAQQPYEMGELGVEYAYKILNGERVIYDDLENKQVFSEVFLINEQGNAIK